MDPYAHTLIATGLLAATFYVARFFGIKKGLREGYLEGSHKGAEHLLNILDDEGTYKRKNLEASVQRWMDAKLDELMGDYEE